MTTRMLLIAWFALCFCFASISPAADAQKQPANVLILNSYNKGLPWTDEQTDGIIGGLRGSDLDTSVFVEYLDWKNNPSPENLRLLYELLKSRYAGKKIDLVMTTDDAALEFALRHRKEIFGAAPVVFSGVYPRAAEIITASEINVTGVYENLDIEGTIRLMVALNPGLQQIYLLFDNTESGSITWAPVEKTAPRVKQGLSVVSLNYLSHEDIAAKLGALPDYTAVLVTSYSRDINGFTMEPERYVRYFAANSSVPVYITYDFESGYGAVGGSVLSGRLQGEEAAKLAVKILKGERAANMIPVDVQDSVTVIDYQQMLKFNLPVDKVPENAVFVNRPLSFFEQNRRVVGIAVTVFVVMTVYIGLLTQNIRRRMAAEAGLKKSNEELAGLYEEVLASQEELQAQYHTLAATQTALQESEERYKLSLDGANDGLWDWDIVADEMFLSERCAELLGLNAHKVSGLERLFATAVPVGEQGRVIDALRGHLAGETPYFYSEHRIITPGGVKWLLARGKAQVDGAGRPVRMAGSITDISERKKSEDAVEYLAYHDPLTSLANRTALNNKLRAVLAAPAGGPRGAVVFIDLDNFKVINDTFGHSYGDRLLIEVSRMLQRIDGGRHFIARVGGDEFFVLLEGANSRAEVAAFAEKVLAIFARPLVVDAMTFYVSVSVGLTMYPEDGTTAEELFKNADLAMYKAKDLGRSRYAFFEQTMDDAVRRKMAMERELREAIISDEFRLWYQPLINLGTGKIKGFEALIRWQSGSRTIMPGDFIKVAEETGLIVPIGDWVLKSACDFAKRLREQGRGNLMVTVNISVVQLMRSDFVPWVLETIAAAGVPPAGIGLEITESLLMESFEVHREKLSEIRQSGVRIYLDDFGTGYSSLKYLRRLPVDTIKIDKSFIDDLTAADDEREIVGSIVALARRAGLKVVAEGVETEYQMAKLRRYNCEAVQGYYFSKPVPEEEVPALLARFG